MQKVEAILKEFRNDCVVPNTFNPAYGEDKVRTMIMKALVVHDNKERKIEENLRTAMRALKETKIVLEVLDLGEYDFSAEVKEMINEALYQTNEAIKLQEKLSVI